ncbi:methytransferase partner Trm112 [Haloplanus sp. C73]|uniref:methytransferase partner Trm112 n=1 Tax=Haloplanus sp. C73 TaxID=3421641 RepID=UPI003EBEB2A1
MKESLMEILCDPLDKSDLELEVDERDGEEIIEGRLVGSTTGEVYPIEDGIPNLLPPDMRDED